MIDEKRLIEEIAELKESQNSENPNFYVGYIVALSTVEGMIAEMMEPLPEPYKEGDV